MLFRSHVAILAINSKSEKFHSSIFFAWVGASDFDPEACYLCYEICMSSSCSGHEINSDLEFLQGGADIELISIAVQPDFSEVAVQEVLGDPGMNNDSAMSKLSTGINNVKFAPRQTIRVDIDRVDRLVDVLGEMVIHQSMLTEAIEKSPEYRSVEIDRSLDQLRQLSRKIQDSILAIRAQPVKPLFDRMHRVLRDALQSSNKSAVLFTFGENTEIDKTVIDRLVEPLTHMIRNSVDHGIEPQAKRLDSGKEIEGCIKLSAFHKSGSLILELSDDGGGLNRKKIMETAILKGLISEGADLIPSEIDNLLFLPGFSTADEISNLSGRGVGMDVVRSEIASLGGKISIASQEGLGTCITVSLPLTLAVMDGMVFEVCGQTLVLPVASVVETIWPTGDFIFPADGGASVVLIREEFLPLVDVGCFLGLNNVKSFNQGEIIVIVEAGHNGHGKIALLVDGIRDQRQIVVKGLNSYCGNISGVSGATVLGDGSVALIMDPAGLILSGNSFI